MLERLAEKRTVASASVAETRRVGVRLGRRVEFGVTICLVGALGSGKTILAAGICRGLGVSEAITSPTFILHAEYRGRLPVVHCDLYRLEHEQELEDLGLFDTSPDEVLVVEWGDRSPRLLAAADVVVDITLTGETSRRIDFHAVPRCTSLLVDFTP